MRRFSKVIVSLLFAVATASATAAGANDADQPPSTPRQQATADRLERVLQDLSNSSDLAIRALYSAPGMEQRSDGNFYVKDDALLAGLLERARGSTDPVALDLLLRRCSMRSTTCDRLDLATRWVDADTQNQVAWLMLASVQRQRGDLDAARAAFVRAARASLWHDHYNDVIRRAVKELPTDLSPAERAAATMTVFAKSGVVLPFQAIQTLGPIAASPAQCARLVPGSSTRWSATPTN